MESSPHAVPKEASSENGAEKTSFTWHGFGRLRERTNFHDAELDYIIANRLAVIVGRDTENREHWMAYSPVDENVFVFVRNSETGEVITVLTLDYYKNGRASRGVDDAAIPGQASFAKRLVEAQGYETITGPELWALREHRPKLRMNVSLVVSMVDRPDTASINFHIPLGEIGSMENFWEELVSSPRFQNKKDRLPAPVARIEEGLLVIGKEAQETGAARFVAPPISPALIIP